MGAVQESATSRGFALNLVIMCCIGSHRRQKSATSRETLMERQERPTGCGAGKTLVELVSDVQHQERACGFYCFLVLMSLMLLVFLFSYAMTKLVAAFFLCEEAMWNLTGCVEIKHGPLAAGVSLHHL